MSGGGAAQRRGERRGGDIEAVDRAGRAPPSGSRRRAPSRRRPPSGRSGRAARPRARSTAIWDRGRGRADSSSTRTRRATCRPAASSPRSALPIPDDERPPRGASATVDGQRQEVGRAGDARVVVADRLLAAKRQLLVGEVEAGFDDGAQILLDRELVLRGGRHDPGVEDRAVLVELVAVVEQARAAPRSRRGRRRGAARPRRRAPRAARSRR